MSKILVVSDTHGDTEAIDLLLNKYTNEVESIIHLGDNSKDVTNAIKKHKNINFYKVVGNCDFHNDDPKEYTLVVDNIRVFLTHGSDYRVKSSLEQLYYKALANKINICLYGHTHIPNLIKKENMILMNPGSPVYPRSKEGASYGLISISEKIILCEIITMNQENNKVLYSLSSNQN